MLSNILWDSDNYITERKKSMKKLFRRIKLFWKMTLGKPYNFNFVSDDEGKPIGQTLKVSHLTLHDMEEWACRCRLTEEVILNSIPANAIKIVGFERIDTYNGITTFQPCEI